MLDKKAILIQNEYVVFTEMEDEDEDEGVLLHLKTKLYFTLNETGIFIWKALHKNNIENIIESLCNTYELSRESAEKTVNAFIQELLSSELIEIVK